MSYQLFRPALWAVCVATVLSSFLSLPIPVLADVPRTISYQGKLTEPDGTPLVGNRDVVIRFYDAATAGRKLWEERHVISLNKSDTGVFSVILGSRTPFPPQMTFNSPVWLTIEVDGDGEFTPRQPLSAVSYAINADTVDGLDSSELISTVRLDEAGALPPVSGAELTDLNASSLTTGTVSNARLSPEVSLLGPLIEPVELASNSVGPDALAADAIQPGDVAVDDLPAHDHVHTHPGTPSAPAGARATVSSSSALGIGTSQVTLLSTSITKSQAGSALLIIATVELRHTANPNDKTVTLQLFRGSTLLDGAYPVRLGTSNRTVSDIPVSLHTLDSPAAGSHTFSLRAQSSAAGAEATVRRLTIIEVP